MRMQVEPVAEAVVMEVFGPGEARGPGDGGIALTAAVDLPPERKVFVARRRNGCRPE